jgi:hypothetical protein
MLPLPAFTAKSRRLFAAIVPALVIASIAQALQGNEEVGGTVTGPLLRLFNLGTAALLAALILSGWLPRSAAVVSALGTVLCLPDYAYGWAPGLFRWLFPGPYAHFTTDVLKFASFDIVGTAALRWMCWIGWQVIWAPKQLHAQCPSNSTAL